MSIRKATWVGILALGVALGASPGRSQGTAQQPPKAPGQPAHPGQTAPGQAETPKLNPLEEAAIKAILAVKPEDSAQMIQLGEEFLKKYPESRYREAVYARLIGAYQNTQQEEKMFAAGEKALELNPDDVHVLSLMAWTMPRRIRTNDLDAEQKLQRAEAYSKHALELLAKLQKPENVAEVDFARAKTEGQAMCHSGLGLVFFHRQRFADAAGEFEQATQGNLSPDPVDYYVLGLSYEQTRRFNDAVTVFNRCAEMSSPLQENCKQNLAAAKKQAATQLSVPKP